MDTTELISLGLVFSLCLAWLALEIRLYFQLAKADKLLAEFSLESKAGAVFPCAKDNETRPSISASPTENEFRGLSYVNRLTH